MTDGELPDIDHDHHMRYALAEASDALERGDRPIGSVIVHGDHVVSRGGNRVNSNQRELDHAEVLALRANWPYVSQNASEYVLYTTLEPCVMCLGTIAVASIRHVVFGESDPKRSGRETYERVPFVARTILSYVGGVLEDECRTMRLLYKKNR